MVHQVEQIWLANTGDRLLRLKADGNFFVEPSTCNRDTVRELMLAIQDALSKTEPIGDGKSSPWRNQTMQNQ